MLPLSHGNPMNFHEKVTIPPNVLSPTHVSLVLILFPSLGTLENVGVT